MCGGGCWCEVAVGVEGMLLLQSGLLLHNVQH